MTAADDVHVLVVDDQPAKLLTYQAILTGLDISLTTAGSAREALDWLLKRVFAVVLIDVCMPELDGFDLAKMIRDHPRFKDTAIIFVSGVHLTDLDRLRGYEVGAVDYVPVPIVPEILRAKVGVFVAMFRQTRQLERLNRELEGRVADRTAELEDANRRKDEFLAVLSHELRNPLAAIRTASEVLAQPQLSRGGLEQTTAVIRRQVGHLARLVDDLVDVSRITRGVIELRREPVTITAVVAQAVEASRPLIEARQHQLTVAEHDPHMTVDGDLARLSQVVSNLLHNAAKFTGPGGRILLDVEKQDGHVVIRVRDNGIGIDAEALPYVFELFTQAGRSVDRAVDGFGIGLALVRRLVEMHGGQTAVRSEGAGMGTEAVVILPLVDAGMSAHSPVKLAELPALPSSRILVADDNADASTSLSMLLTMWGHVVRTAADGVEVLERAPEFQPRVVLLDLGMPRLDGYETARRIREQPWGRDIALIALTGWGQPQDRDRTSRAGFDAHLVKPVSNRDLADALGRFIGPPRHTARAHAASPIRPRSIGATMRQDARTKLHE